MCLQEYRDGSIMSNANKAKELRKKQAAEQTEKTQEALASSAEAKETTVAVEKIQDELENTKLVLDECKKEKESLQEELSVTKTTEAEQTALLAKRADEIAALTAAKKK